MLAQSLWQMVSGSLDTSTPPRQRDFQSLAAFRENPLLPLQGEETCVCDLRSLFLTHMGLVLLLCAWSGTRAHTASHQGGGPAWLEESVCVCTNLGGSLDLGSSCDSSLASQGNILDVGIWSICLLSLSYLGSRGCEVMSTYWLMPLLVQVTQGAEAQKEQAILPWAVDSHLEL